VTTAVHPGDVVLILARPTTNTHNLATALSEIGLRPTTLGDVDASLSLASELLEAVEHAAFVVVVWDTTRLSRALVFELGFAAGAGVPIAVLDARSEKSASSSDVVLDALLGGPRLHARLNDTASLMQEFEALLPSLVSFRDLARYRSQYKPRVTELSKVELGSEASKRTRVALISLGASLVSSAGEVPDFIARFHHLEAAFNPVLVEVAGLRARLDRKLEQLKKAMQAGSARLAILVTLDDVGPWQAPGPKGAAIIVVSLRDLEESPKTVRFELQRARNAIVHGAL